MNKHLRQQPLISHQLTDEELLERHKRTQQKHLLNILFKRYTNKVLGLCISYLKNPQDGEDAAMEIFEQLCQTIHQYNINKFEPWLYFVTRNYCLKRLKQALQRNWEDVNEINPDLFVETGLNEDPYSETRLEQLSDAIDQLNEDQRLCVVLFYLEQHSYQEIADRTNFSLNQVKSFIQNGKRNLRNALIKKTA